MSAIIVKIPEHTRRSLHMLAVQRNEVKKGVTKNQRVDPKQDDVEMNYHGLLGEHAVATLLHTEVDREISARGDGGIHDLIVNSVTLQVKFTKHINGVLLFRTVERFRADVAVLTTAQNALDEDIESIRVVGWISRESFRSMHRVRNFGFGDNCIVPQNALSPMSELVTLLRSSGETA